MTRDGIIGLVVGASFTAAAFVIVEGTQPQAQPISCMAHDLRDRAKAIMIDALDEALKNRIDHVFEIWMKDASEQPSRAAVGTRQAIRAWANSRRFVERWDPPECP